MTNYYAYHRRRDYREEQAIYEAECERKMQRKAKIEDYFTANLYPGKNLVFKTVALSESGLIVQDDLCGAFWVVKFEHNPSFKLNQIVRCYSLDDAKARFYELIEESP